MRRLALATAGIGALVWAWFGSGVRTFTRPAEVLTFLPGLAVLLLTLLPSASSAGIGAAALPPYRRWSVLPWLVVLAAIVAWELVELFSKPRGVHPTISSVMDSLLSTHPSRFVGYLVWLVLGWLLVRDLGRRP